MTLQSALNVQPMCYHRKASLPQFSISLVVAASYNFRSDLSLQAQLHC